MPRFFVVASFLALTALSLGCAGSGPHSDNVPQATVDADYNDCENRGVVSTALIRSPSEAEDKRQEIIDTCMKEKGYKIK